MAVKISSAKPVVSCPATLYLAGDNGSFDTHSYHVSFRRVTDDERKALSDGVMAGTLTVRELLDQVVVGWAGMRDEHDAEVPYSHAERIAANNAYIGLEQSMAVAWFDTFGIHQREAAAKNSEAPSATA